MAKFYDSWEDMQADRNDGFTIDNQVNCPRCGSPDCTILKMPTPGAWMARFGKAKCNHCRIQFGIMAIDEDER